MGGIVGRTGGQGRHGFADRRHLEDRHLHRRVALLGFVLGSLMMVIGGLDFPGSVRCGWTSGSGACSW